MKDKTKIPAVGLVLIVIGIIFYCIGGIYLYWSDTIMFATWLTGLGQILIFAGIGFILFGIYKRFESERELPLDELLDKTRRRIDELPDKEEIETPKQDKIKVTCPTCTYKYEIEESDVGSETICPNCEEVFRIKTKPPKSFKAEDKTESG